MRLLLAQLLLLTSTTVFSQNKDFETQCSTVHTVSGMMDVFSAERSKTIAEVMEWFPESVYGTHGHRVIREIVLDWYEQPEFQTYEYKTRAEEAFQNKWALRCYKDYERFRFWDKR